MKEKDARDRVYIAVDEPKSLDGGDIFEEVFSTVEEADDEAYYQWRHLTRWEQQRRHIYVTRVERADLMDEAFMDYDDEGVVHWEARDGDYPCDGFFDSDNLPEEE